MYSLTTKLIIYCSVKCIREAESIPNGFRYESCRTCRSCIKLFHFGQCDNLYFFLNFVNVQMLLRYGVENLILSSNIEKCPRPETTDSQSGTRELVILKLEACLMIWGLVKRVLNHLQMACQICAEGFVNREGLSVLLTKRL